LIVGRGGGSIEDLWSFNEEVVARAIAASEIPVISAVGHEIDFTIADFTADLRAPTPSAAAELVSGSRREIEEKVGVLRRRLVSAAREKTLILRKQLAATSADQLLARTVHLISRYGQNLDEARIRLERSLMSRVTALRRRLDGLSFSERVRGYQFVLSRLSDRLGNLHARSQIAGRARIERFRFALDGLNGRLQAMDPKAILTRGYSICRTKDGDVLKVSADVSRGDRVSVELHRGSLDCEVLDTD
ncbi:exodeoxyribonuclease VII large subunit, partial [Acidobacteriota bacterium]